MRTLISTLMLVAMLGVPGPAALAQDSAGKTIKDGSRVGLEYTLTDDAGTVLDSNKGEEPFVYTQGARQIVPGLGHPLHKPVDPRAPRLFRIAADNGFSRDYVRLEQLICAEAERTTGKMLPVNATGAIGAICCELGLPWKIVRGVGVFARAIGLVGHILEESNSPMAVEIWQRVEDEATAHIRPGAR